MHSTAIAIVADDPSVRQTMRGILSHGNYAIHEYDVAGATTQGSLKKAFAVCLSVSTDIDVLQRVRAAAPGLPVVVIGTQDMASPVLDAGAYDFVHQPIDPASLRRVVAHAVEKRELMNKVQELRTELTTRSSNPEDGGPEGEVVVPLRELERRAIEGALRATKGSVTKAAKLLGIGRATLYRRLASPEMASLRPRRGYEAPSRNGTSNGSPVSNPANLAAAGDSR